MALKEWMRAFAKCMQASKCGKEEAAAKNNHGTFYDATLVTLALYVGDKELAKKVLEESKTKRIAAQIQPDGSLPLEMAQTKSYGYSNSTWRRSLRWRRSAITLGWICALRDEGRPRHPQGARLAAPYATGEKKWTHKQFGRLSPAGWYRCCAAPPSRTRTRSTTNWPRK